MPKLVFISPIGATDPLKNKKDGPMIHIARKYMPDKIYLLLTNEMLKYENSTHKYSECIKQLYAQNKKGISDNEIIPIHLNIDDASDFEAFSIYTNILEEIISENEDSEFIANLSSGTPQMISSLALCIVNNNLPIKSIQVKTPNNRANYPNEESFDIETSEDNNEQTFNDRNVEVNLFNFKRSACYKQVDSFCKDFSYDEAIKALKKEQFEQDNELLELLEIGRDYINFENENLKERCDKYNIHFDNKSLEKMVILNAYNVLSTKNKHYKYSDFILGLTPLFYKVCKRCVERVFKLNEITFKNKDKKTYVIVDKVKQIEIKEISDLIRTTKSEFYLDSKFLVAIYKNINKLKEDYSELFGANNQDFDENIANTLNEIRTIESNLRNNSAHDTFLITIKDFQRANTSPRLILNKLKELITYSFYELVTDNDFRFFANLNIKIKERLKDCL